MSDNGDSMSFGKGLFWGALIGAGLALLFAPRSGVETREMLKDEVMEMKEKAREMKEQADRSIREMREKAREMKEQADRSINEMREKAAETKQGA